MGRRFRALRGLRRHDLGLLVQAWGVLLAVDLGLRLWPLARIQAWAATCWAPRGGKAEAGVWPAIERFHRLVGIASRHHLCCMHCLQRSLALQRMLSRRGISTELCFGVRHCGEALSAHAWLEYQGQAIGEPEALEERFARLEAGDHAS